MKIHSQEFKKNIKQFGRELNCVIKYTLNGEEVELGNNELNSITPVFETDLLKSVMKELDIDSNVDIPIGTELNFKFGISHNGSEYEYLDFGNYIVKEVEKQEDTNSYNIVCFDKMLYSMKDYEKLQTTKKFPMAIRDYIDSLCTDIGLTFKNKNDSFVNYNRTISGDLYANLGYTYRDIFDEIAQVTASNIVINEDDEVEIRYITDTQDTIDEEYLKDVNVAFGEKYGPINSIVLSRAAESDNIYLRNEQSIKDNGLCELKIVDNQIMNFNDRSDYLPDILLKLNGLEYYTNDFSSIGICYYDVCDKYNVQIGDEVYSCVMFNDQINIEQGLEELIHTDLPEQAETDYTKADKTDRRINQTYIIVDKQNQTIESMVSQVDGQNQKISQVLQTVDEINQKISETMDLTVSGESTQRPLELNGINESEPITIRVQARIENISYLYPNSKLYPSNNLYLKNRIIRFTNKKTGEVFDYLLPDNLLYYDTETYDEFFLNYDTQTCQVIKKCGYNADGTVRLLTESKVVDYPYPNIYLSDGDYEVSLPGYNSFYLYVTLMGANIYTSQFATRAELNSRITQTVDKIESEVSQVEYMVDKEVASLSSRITQTAGEINQEVAKKVGNNEIISRINQTPETITINASKINLQGYVTVSDLSGSGTTTINGSNITTGSINANRINGGTINGNNVNITNLNASNITTGSMSASRITSGTMSANRITGGTLSGTTISGNTITGGTISGATITATSGTISGWTLGKSKAGLSSLTGKDILGRTVAIGPDVVEIQTSSTLAPASSWYNIISQTISDRRLKNTIENIEDKYEDFYDNLKPVTFKFNKDFDVANYDKTHFGFIAQDIVKNEKQNTSNDLALVSKEDSECYSLDKTEIVALNTWQIQKLKEQVKNQQQQIKNLQNQINNLYDIINKESDK